MTSGERNCVDAVRNPGNKDKTCDALHLFDIEYCAGDCSNTDNCNNYTPSGATGIMATKCVMTITGFAFA